VSRFKILIAAILSLTFVWWFLTRATLMGFVQGLLHVDAWVWGLVATGLLLSYGLRAWRIAHEFRSYEGMRFGVAFRVVLWHNASVNVMPFRTGEAAFPLLLRRAAGVPLVRSAATLLWLRLQDACTLLMLGIWTWPQSSLLLRVTLSGIVLLGVAGLWWLARRPGQWSLSERWPRLSQLREALAHASEHAQHSWLVTFSNWAIKLCVQALVLQSVLQAAWGVGLAGALGAELSALSPIQGVAGFGSYEAGSAAAMQLLGIDWVHGLQAAALMHLVMLVSSLFWAALAWLWPGHQLDSSRFYEHIQS